MSNPETIHPDPYAAAARFRCEQGHGTWRRDQLSTRRGSLVCPVGLMSGEICGLKLETELSDVDFIQCCERDSLDDIALNPLQMERLFRLAGRKGDLPNYRIAYPPLWEMIEDAKRACDRDTPPNPTEDASIADRDAAGTSTHLPTSAPPLGSPAPDPGTFYSEAHVLRLRDALEAARELIQKHDNWHHNVGTVLFPAEEGQIGPTWINLAAEYADATLCEETIAVLDQIDKVMK